MAPSRSGPRDERWLVLAATSKEAAQSFATGAGVADVVILDKTDLVELRFRVTRAARGRPFAGAMLHSKDWCREAHPQLYLIAMFASGARNLLLADEAAGRVLRVPRGRLGLRLSRLPGEALMAVLATTQELGHFRSLPPRPGWARARRDAHPDSAVLVIWGENRSSSVGGAVSHLSGILGAFRKSGMRIGLVATGPLPEQLRGVVDDIEVAAPVSAAGRLLGDTASLLENRAIRGAARKLGGRLRPTFVYQRHREFLFVGWEVAADLGLPFVLEWNASVAWTWTNWLSPYKPFKRQLTAVVRRIECRMAAEASVVAAVSKHAADMAVDAGAARKRVITVPNGVDFERVHLAARNPRRPGDATQKWVGWIGTFGPWHGAEILLEATPSMMPDVSVLMIGEGARREACQRLARDLGLGERIVWAGQLPHREALSLLAGCDVLASPHVAASDDQPFFGSPTKLFEYMALGRPIVASRLEQLGEILEDGRTALLVPPGDPAALAAGITEVLELPDLGQSMGRAAQEDAKRLHTWERRSDQILTSLAGLAAPGDGESEDRR